MSVALRTTAARRIANASAPPRSPRYSRSVRSKTRTKSGSCWFPIMSNNTCRRGRAARIAHRALVIVVSDFLTTSSAWEHSLRAVAAKHDVVAAQISDPREWELPQAGRVCVQDPETGEQFILNTSHPTVRLRYAERMS